MWAGVCACVRVCVCVGVRVRVCVRAYANAWFGLHSDNLLPLCLDIIVKEDREEEFEIQV